jgi:hypothetical protein
MVKPVAFKPTGTAVTVVGVGPLRVTGIAGKLQPLMAFGARMTTLIFKYVSVAAHGSSTIVKRAKTYDPILQRTTPLTWLSATAGCW